MLSSDCLISWEKKALLSCLGITRLTALCILKEQCEGVNCLTVPYAEFLHHFSFLTSIIPASGPGASWAFYLPEIYWYMSSVGKTVLLPLYCTGSVLYYISSYGEKDVNTGILTEWKAL